MTLFRFEWPSLSRELRKWVEAKTGHEDAVPLHLRDQQPSKAVPAEPQITGIEREEMERQDAEFLRTVGAVLEEDRRVRQQFAAGNELGEP